MIVLEATAKASISEYVVSDDLTVFVVHAKANGNYTPVLQTESDSDKDRNAAFEAYDKIA
jgi:hypothetical protein